jgi:hypothetical protein
MEDKKVLILEYEDDPLSHTFEIPDSEALEGFDGRFGGSQ